jgi:hypothetical protein
MPTRMVCLANSFKEGGRCIAGIELDNENKVVLQNGRPKWIRPVCSTPHSEVPNSIAEPFKLLDIIELEITERRPENYQSENVLFKEKSIRKTGVFNKNLLVNYCDNTKYIFSTSYASLSEEVISQLDHSLLLIKLNSFEIIEKPNEQHPDKPKYRFVFTHNNIKYDFPITDPSFLKRYQKSKDFIKEITEVILCLSLGIKFPPTERYYKLVAGIIY